METINIKYKGEKLEKRLSNLYPYKFEMDGIEFESMEGFIQSLRTPDIIIKKKIWNKSGFIAWKLGQKIDWETEQKVYWVTTPINRNSEEFNILITKAYDSLFINEDFKQALKESLSYKLDHTIGQSNKKTTLLTKKEFLDQLNRLRNKLTERKFFNLNSLFQ